MKFTKNSSQNYPKNRDFGVFSCIGRLGRIFGRTLSAVFGRIFGIRSYTTRFSKKIRQIDGNFMDFLSLSLYVKLVYDRIPNIRPNIRPKTADNVRPNIRRSRPIGRYEKNAKIHDFRVHLAQNFEKILCRSFWLFIFDMYW